MNLRKEIVQIEAVYPGPFGGGWFKGDVVGKRETLHFQAGAKILSRLPRIGEFWAVEGRIINDPERGQQVLSSECRLVDLPEVKYLSSLLSRHGAFRGFYFGTKKVAQLFEAFEPEKLLALLNEGDTAQISAALSKNKKKNNNHVMAQNLIDAWKNLASEVSSATFLFEHKFSPTLARQVIRLCRRYTADRLRQNPYYLVCFGGLTRNIWRTVELCAVKLKIPRDDERRLVGGVEHILYEQLREGHTAMPENKLVESVSRVLRGGQKRAEEGIRLALRKKAVCVFIRDGQRFIQLLGPAYIEASLERHIKRLLEGESPKVSQPPLFSGSEKEIRRLVENYTFAVGEGDKRCQVSLNSQQKEAVVMALTRRCSVITGYGGTGKTTVLKAIVDIAQAFARHCSLMALSGKAKERLKAAVNDITTPSAHQIKPWTIHALISRVESGVIDLSKYDNPLIIIDESSMVDVALFNNLLNLLDGKNFSLLTVGDTELMPVGFGIAWHKMAQSAAIPRVNLTEVFRQKEYSPIHKLAMQVRKYDEKGKDRQIDVLQIWAGEDEGVFLVPCAKHEIKEALRNIKIKLPTAQILTPHMSERMPDSGHRINKYLQNELNGDAKRIALGHHWLHENDPVIVTETKNDIDLFNGTMGVLRCIEITNGELVGVFDLEGHPQPLTLDTDAMFDVGMMPAYAISIHKSQGSEMDVTAICCVVDNDMIERSLIYTALTRAKKLCLIVGSQNVFDRAVHKKPKAETLCVGFSI